MTTPAQQTIDEIDKAIGVLRAIQEFVGADPRISRSIQDPDRERDFAEAALLEPTLGDLLSGVVRLIHAIDRLFGRLQDLAFPQEDA